MNFILILLLLFRKTVRNCSRAYQQRKQQRKQVQQQAAARQQTERYTIALKQMLASQPPQSPSTPNLSLTPSTQPLF